ncbi:MULTISPECIES: autorepressor SdpR family transcription factor [unclassified Clostridium]|uniref:autorepressor SdpR family transcription factor n=1 Tax=unclassified Clostridium TaxID=2614128 RepID=UPI0013EE7F10|nr:MULTISPECIES: autorepressor SdpR family transcription factor [unclassified Clostridium]MBN1038903.1 ArsR family transcriptional regulator [Clostridium botulinum]MBZ9691936.1 autorepressor SdpR family transcription factor [Clostridium sp. M14]NFR88207.1 winged helix-turn-helix transcriptional regulator [Clostridium botulinum]NFR91132.1 winged helix-turn-helix transcriptional regulator [Clostridium botulinum]NFU00267.1 winged helix-turn-helix transcriptional regulator [Clostridium botulinum]
MPFNDAFKALSDNTRRKILDLLNEKDMTAGDIADYFQITKPSISHHLSILKQAGLVSDKRKGQFIYYSLNTSVFEDVIKWFISFLGNTNEGKD